MDPLNFISNNSKSGFFDRKMKNMLPQSFFVDASRFLLMPQNGFVNASHYSMPL
jgi:hypothetical protein